jgi:hypothetical protein
VQNSRQLFYSSRSFVTISILALLLFCSCVTAGGKSGIYGIHMVPNGNDAENYSRPGYGLGIHIVRPLKDLHNYAAFTAGLEMINLMSKTTGYSDSFSGLAVEQQTSQNYFRLFLGGQLGSHGRGMVRPHAGMNLALVFYGIDTDVVIPDDYDYENEIRQNLEWEYHAVLGSDITLGVDFNFRNKWNIDVGVKYLKSFSVPQQLSARSIHVHPEYFQIYVGFGLSFTQLMSN